MTAADFARRELLAALEQMMVAEGAPSDDAAVAAAVEVDALTDAEAVAVMRWAESGGSDDQ